MAPPNPIPLKSKTITTWLAFLGGSLGAHRFYLYGSLDGWAWLHGVPTGLGLLGVWRMAQLGQDDPLAWLLIPCLGLMLSGTQLLAIVYGLMPDEKWDERFNQGRQSAPSTGLNVLAVVLALMIGGGVLMATVAFGMMRWAEYSLAMGPNLGEFVNALASHSRQ